jgi:hypothetical protein
VGSQSFARADQCWYLGRAVVAVDNVCEEDELDNFHVRGAPGRIGASSADLHCSQRRLGQDLEAFSTETISWLVGPPAPFA